MLPLSAVLYRRPPVSPEPAPSESGAGPRRPLGFSPTQLQCLICAAGIGCCAAMAMPQVHIVAYATDLGHAAARAAEMLSLMLGFGIVSRLASGWISDRIGGLNTLLLGSFLQCCVLAAFLVADSLVALYAFSVAFGLAQGGIVPSYAIIVRTFFPNREAGWRIGMALLFTILGMALGGWMAGALYDLTGSYTLSFVNAIAFNLLNMAIAAKLLRRAKAQGKAFAPA
jgi:MFS family permease